MKGNDVKNKNPPYFDYMQEFSSFKEMIEKTTKRFEEKNVYSYRLRPTDNTIHYVSYRRFYNEVKAIATNALHKGLSGKHVALVGKLSYQWLRVYFSMISIGAVLVPLDPDWHDDELAATIAKAECHTVFFSESVRKKMETVSRIANVAEFHSLDGDGEDTLSSFRKAGTELLLCGDTSFDEYEPIPDALCELVFTSGTTGKGKGVMLSQKCILSDLHGAFSILTIGQKTLAVLPPHHTYGSTIALLSPYCNGSETYITSGMRYTLKELAEQKPEFLILVPLYLETFYRKVRSGIEKEGKKELVDGMVKVTGALSKFGINVSNRLYAKTVLSAFGGKLKMIVCGGAPLSEEIAEYFERFGIRILNGYGITECSPLISANRLEYSVKYSAGVPIPEVEILIDKPNENGEGEICVKGSNVMLGYYKDNDATSAAIDSNGFFHTGDIGKVDGNVIYVTGRVKNLIILSNGKNVYPEEIESELMALPGVSEVVVYEGESREKGKSNAIVAEIYPDRSYFEINPVDSIYSYFTEKITEYNRKAVSYKKVEKIKIRNEEFPKNTLRKIMRFKIDKSID